MSSESSRPSWQLPPGVSKGAWDYVTQKHIATDYDAFHQGHPLLDLDRGIVLEVAKAIAEKQHDRTPIALDLGCGTGRTLRPLAGLGWRCIGVDLSDSMLQCAASMASQEMDHAESAMVWVRGNIAQLEFLTDSSLDLATCLYSSIGMVQGRKNRLNVFSHIARALRPEGRFIVHVHNRGIWFRDPGGLWRILRDQARSWFDSRWEYGDRVYAYRGLPSMYLHIFSETELRQDLRHAGLRLERMIPLNLTSSQVLDRPWFLRSQRAGGFIAIAMKDILS